MRSLLRPVLPFLALTLLVSAGAGQDAPPAPAVTPPPGDPAKPPQEEPAILKKAKGYKEVVTAARGLPFKTDVKVGLYSKEELLVFLKEEMKREAPDEKVLAQEKALKHFGLIPGKMNLKDAVLSLLGSAIAGFYHPRTKELRLIKSGDGTDVPIPMFNPGVSIDDITLVHELTHAAQDQSYDLDTLPLDDEENDDLISALKGLIEGDATVCSMQWALPAESYEQIMAIMNDSYKQAQLPGEAGNLPAYLRRTVAFGYGYGVEFVSALYKNANNKWTDVDKAFTDLPSSTEQILHPEKYLSPQRDNPQEIRIKDADAILGGSWKRLLTNVHGEFGIYLLLNEFKASDSRKKAAAGWDGDRFYVYEGPKPESGPAPLASIWLSTWDAERDATEFFEAYVPLLQAKYPSATLKASQSGAKSVLSWKDGQAVVERRGSDVLVIDGGPASLETKIDDLFKGSSKSEVKKVARVERKN